jgi:hypothetical protein
MSAAVGLQTDNIELVLEEAEALYLTLPDPDEPGIPQPQQKLRRASQKRYQILISQIKEFIGMEKSFDNLLALYTAAGAHGGESDKPYFALKNRFLLIMRTLMAPLYHTKLEKDVRNITGFRGMRTHVKSSYNPANYPTPESHYLHKPKFAVNSLTELMPNRSRHSAAIRDTYLVPETKTPVFDAWIEAQYRYISHLSEKDKSLLKGYTYYGDTLLNSYCRGGLPKDITSWLIDFKEKILEGPDSGIDEFDGLFIAYLMYDTYTLLKEPLTLPPKPPNVFDVLPYLSEVFTNNIVYFSDSRHMIPLLEQFKRELIRIISAAPRPGFPITVYRGFKSEKHLTSATYTNKDFISTSIDIMSALYFVGIKPDDHAINGIIDRKLPRTSGGFYELTVTPGTPCLYISPISAVGDQEKEILFMPGLTVELDNTVRYKDLSLIRDRWTKGSTMMAVIHGTISEAPHSKRKTNYAWNAVNHAPVSYKTARRATVVSTNRSGNRGTKGSKGKRTYKQSRQTRLNRTKLSSE